MQIMHQKQPIAIEKIQGFQISKAELEIADSQDIRDVLKFLHKSQFAERFVELNNATNFEVGGILKIWK